MKKKKKKGKRIFKSGRVNWKSYLSPLLHLSMLGG